MNNVKVAEKKIDELAEFLMHNIQQGYISRETTVDELIMFIRNIKEGYLPLVKLIDEAIKEL